MAVSFNKCIVNENIASRALQWLLIILAFSLLLSCSSRSETDAGNGLSLQHVPMSSLQLQKSADCTDLKGYVTRSLVKRYTALPRYNYYQCRNETVSAGGGGEVTTSPSPGSEDASSAAPEQKASTPDGVSETNNQEQGVNEGDIVKADEQGNIYVLTGRHLIVTKGFPPQDLTTLKELDLGARGLDMFLDEGNNRLIVVAREEAPYYITDPAPVSTDAVSLPVQAWDYSIAIFLDVSDPSNPVVIDQIQFRGYYREGRRINDRLHLVSSHYMQVPELYADVEFQELRQQLYSTINEVNCEEGGLSQSELANDPRIIQVQSNLSAKITNVVDSLNPADFLPDAVRANGDMLEPISYLACSDIHHPDVDMTLGMQIIASVDTNGDQLSATGIVNNAWVTYVSADNLYLADVSRNWWWASESDQPPTSQTAIYKFSISSGQPTYVAIGRVDGYVRNQFSFSEHNGMLRLATTQNDTIVSIDENGDRQWQQYLNNHLFVMGDNGAGMLNTVGEVRDFEADETIRSVRFYGDKGFVVTFRNIDPFFTFDLSEPSNPKLMGELTLPGFSTYMHKYDDDHIITIGRAGAEGGFGVGSGMQMQLINVSDLTAPTLLHTYNPSTDSGWSWSAAEYDHKAFTFYKQANVLAIPMRVTPDYSATVFNGIAAFDVTLESGFSELGRVDHSDIAHNYYCVGNPDLSSQYSSWCENGRYVQWAAPRRSVVMTSAEDVYLYSISDMGLKVSETKDLSATIGSLIFPPQPYPWWWYRGVGVVQGDAERAVDVGAASSVLF